MLEHVAHYALAFGRRLLLIPAALALVVAAPLLAAKIPRRDDRP